MKVVNTDTSVSKKLKHPAYTPQWVKENENYSQEWTDFISMYWEESKAAIGTKAGAVRGLCRWAVEKRHFKTPYDIKPEDLLNPFIHSEEASFFAHLHDFNGSENYKFKAWENASRLYTLVVKAARLPGSPLSRRDIGNPFFHVPNPFRGALVKEAQREYLQEVQWKRLLDLSAELTNAERIEYERLKEEVVRLDKELRNVKAELKRYKRGAK